jgi:hypothetical protein
MLLVTGVALALRPRPDTWDGDLGAGAGSIQWPDSGKPCGKGPHGRMTLRLYGWHCNCGPKSMINMQFSPWPAHSDGALGRHERRGINHLRQ